MQSEELENAPKIRKMTVCRKGFARQGSEYAVFHIISLSGKWLKESGFRAGHVIDIACEQGRLVITLAEEQRFPGI
jgi:hypothetical protein